MAEITSALFKLFGNNGTSDKFGKFGSAAAGSPVNTKVISTIQGLAAWDDGWHEEINSGDKAIYVQDLNSFSYVFAYQLAHILEKGVPEWETTRTYYIGDIVKKNGTFELYGSLVAGQSGNALGSQADNANWKYLGLLGTVIGAAVETDQEAGTSAKLAVTPAVQQFHPSAAKAYAEFDGTTSPATIKKGYGISSIVNLGGGHYKVVFSVPFSSVYYIAIGNAEYQVGVSTPIMLIDNTPKDASNLYIFFVNSTNAGGIAPTDGMIAVFGDQ